MEFAAQYLDRYAESESHLAAELSVDVGHVIVIPSYGEGRSVRTVLDSIPAGVTGPVLTILVINEPPDSPPELRALNEDTKGLVRQRYPRICNLSDETQVFEHPHGPLVMLDRTAERAIARHQGVGLARKIGMDLALAVNPSVSYLHTTDADAELPSDYFSVAESAPPSAAVLYRFTHIAEPDTSDAVYAYEAFLRYYVLGLRYAHSPYAHHTVGSTMAASPSAYAAVRGMPKRSGGEDFHFLNKVCKVGRIHGAMGEPLKLSGRVSTRTPFGTGRALHELGDQELHVYDPRIFELLGNALSTLERAVDGVALDQAFDADLSVSDRKFVADALRLTEIDYAIDHARQHGLNQASARRHLHTFFDGLRTLKFVHFLRDAAYPSVPLRKALKDACFVDVDEGVPLRELNRQLERLEFLDTADV